MAEVVGEGKMAHEVIRPLVPDDSLTVEAGGKGTNK